MLRLKFAFYPSQRPDWHPEILRRGYPVHLHHDRMIGPEGEELCTMQMTLTASGKDRLGNTALPTRLTLPTGHYAGPVGGL